MQQLRKVSIHLFVYAILSVSPMQAQYWQQYVEYNMNIVLDTDEKTLTATSDLLYVNHSPDTLDQLLMHLYDNAFNAGTIAHQVRGNSYESYISGKEWTGIQIKAAVVDSIPMAFIIRDDTILDITLTQSLSPGDTLNFALDWISILHPQLGRAGYTRQQFDFAQWYPKFVVYDENGWHDDPFGTWGEFYGEFGNFTVHMDVPAEQIVGAAGVVIDGDPGWSEVTVDTSVVWEEWVAAFRENRGATLAEMDSSDRRQVSFFAENVHDFAWLCSPDFVYEHGSWNGIDVHSLFTSEVGAKWTKDVVEHGVSSLQWLSEKFGPYPWPQMTISKALLGGGMEYPMLIMDASESEGLIVHEIGHNWFYGMFGNDELDDAWLDEGFTSFQENWYKEHFYPDNGYAITRKSITQFESENLPRQMIIETDLKSVIRYMTSPLNEPIATHSHDFIHSGSYRTNVYDKTAVMLHSLKVYLGEERFLSGMSLYYDRWALKHVNEARFIKSMEDATGEELDWFFDQWLHTAKYVDYKLAAWESRESDKNRYLTTIDVENIGGLFVPIAATIYGPEGQRATASLQEFRYRDNGTIEIESDFKPIRVFLDADNVFLDVDRRNNDSQKKPSWRYNFKGWNEYPDHRNLYMWKPQFAYNDADGLGLGVRLDRVYRNTGDFMILELSQNLSSGNPDGSLSFKEQQLGLPFKANLSGSAGSWRSMSTASLEYEINWAKTFWKNPVHYLTLKVDYTDASNASLASSDQNSFTRLSMQYELQHNILGGNYGFSAMFQFSPGSLGNYGNPFSQFSIMDNWSKNFGLISLNNRTNFLANSLLTPDLVKSRVGSQDMQAVYLNHLATSLHKTDAIDMIGPRYYLVGGARMRGYADSLDVPVNYLWSNNLDITITSSPFHLDKVDLGLFFDIGQISDTGTNWDWVGDAGLGLQVKPTWKRNSWLTTLLRPVSFKIELPLARIENDNWVSTLENNQWVFSVSY